MTGWLDRKVAAQLGVPDELFDVLCGAASGLTNAEIGRPLFLHVDTVKRRLRRLYRVLGARDRAHAVALAYDLGLLRPRGVAS